MLLQNVPEAVKSLLDNCIVANDVGSDNIGKVVFDFFLFQPETGDDELALVDLVIATGKKKLIEHPLFETFIRLKWIKIWKVYTLSFMVRDVQSDMQICIDIWHGQKGKDALVISREFGSGDDANAWRKSTNEADKD